MAPLFGLLQDLFESFSAAAPASCTSPAWPRRRGRQRGAASCYEDPACHLAGPHTSPAEVETAGRTAHEVLLSLW